jgi:hypothetical protein
MTRLTSQSLGRGLARLRALLTCRYAWATFRILRANEGVVTAMREQTEAQLRPYVVVCATVRTGTTLLSLEVQNTGRSPALDLRLKLDRDFYANGEREEGKNLATLPAFTETIESLPPGARMNFILGVGGTIFSTSNAELCPRLFHVHANYSHAGRAYSEDNTIDMRPMLHNSAFHDPVADEIKALRESLERLKTNT